MTDGDEAGSGFEVLPSVSFLAPDQLCQVWCRAIKQHLSPIVTADEAIWQSIRAQKDSAL